MASDVQCTLGKQAVVYCLPVWAVVESEVKFGFCVNYFVFYNTCYYVYSSEYNCNEFCKNNTVQFLLRVSLNNGLYLKTCAEFFVFVSFLRTRRWDGSLNVAFQMQQFSFVFMYCVIFLCVRFICYV